MDWVKFTVLLKMKIWRLLEVSDVRLLSLVTFRWVKFKQTLT
jgi:hypothetical protein